MRTKAILVTFIVLYLFSAGCTSTGNVETGPLDSGVPVAGEGFDTVAYFAADSATKGSRQFSFFWNGANWLFSNRENLERFKSDPARYAPQFDSYCPVSLSNGGNAKGNPRFWKVVSDKLYFFNSEENRGKFENDREAVLKKAAENYKQQDK